MKNFILKTVCFLALFFGISKVTFSQNSTYVEKKMFFKIYLASEVEYTVEDADVIDKTFNNSMFIYGCKTNIETKICELHATDGLNKHAIIDLLSYTGRGYKVARIDESEE